MEPSVHELVSYVVRVRVSVYISCTYMCGVWVSCKLVYAGINYASLVYRRVCGFVTESVCICLCVCVFVCLCV
jgi:hypothetical protein